MIEQSTLEKPKTRNISHKFTPNCALRNLAGFAEFAQICSTTQTRNRDKNGNLLSEIAGRYRKDYVYNAQNRMIFSDVQDAFLNTRNLTEYRYDAFGRRIETIEYLGDHTRNLYDGFSFDIAEKTVLQTHAAATMPEQKYRAGGAGANSSHPELGSGSVAAGRSGAGVANGTRYRYIGDENLVPLEQAGSAAAGGNNGANASTTATAKTRSRPNSEYVLYSNGEPVAVNSDNGVSYFGTDILGSVRSVTDRNGQVKASYEYDAFGAPYLSNLENDVGFGYCGKVYDSATGLYDYGFRDYSPNSARFTTVDPVRDGSNWFSYVVNDPVNYIDPFGLTPYDVPNQTYLGDKDGKSYFRVDEGGTKWGLANATGTPLNEVNGYDGVAESMPIGTILSIPSQINNSGTTPSNSNNAINTSPAITAQSFSQSSSFASVGMSTGGQNTTTPANTQSKPSYPVYQMYSYNGGTTNEDSSSFSLYLSPLEDSSIETHNRNQYKSEKKIYLSVDIIDSVLKNGYFSFNAETGFATVSTEFDESQLLYLQGQFDLLNAGISFTNTTEGKGGGAGFSANFVSVSGNVGYNNKNVKITIGGSLGICTGAEFFFDYREGIVIDIGALIEPRIEIFWRKR